MGFGHRRIGYLGATLTISTADERVRGYTEGLAAHGIAFDPGMVRTGLATVEDAERAATELFRGPDRPTALLSGQNYFTIGAVKALRALGLHHRVAVVGFDDFLLADILDPPITVVAHDPVDLGRAAAESLITCAVRAQRSNRRRYASRSPTTAGRTFGSTTTRRLERLCSISVSRAEAGGSVPSASVPT